MIFNTKPVVIDSLKGPRRSSPRPVEDQQNGYTEQFDDLTVFYDVFCDGSRVVLSGPPLRNLKEDLALEFSLDGTPVLPFLSDKGRTQRSYIEDMGHILRIEGAGVDTTVEVAPSANDLFAGRRVLMTLSMNNSLKWMTDWAAFYARVHGVDAVLVYDNGSDAYDLEQLDAALAAVPGIKVVVVVDWPAKYGPGAGPSRTWDSNFLQTSQMEHARYRFLLQAKQVINADIDELVLTNDGRPLGDHLDANPAGVLLYWGRWIEATRQVENDSFDNHWHFDPQLPRCPRKWTIMPAKVPANAAWDTHTFVDWQVPDTADILYRHFRPISTNWKAARRSQIRDEKDLLVDEDLRLAIGLQ